MAVRRILVYVPLLVAFVFLISCNLGIEVPDYFIDVKTDKHAYDSPSGIVVWYRFVAENESHLCRYELTKDNTAEIPSSPPEVVQSKIWHSKEMSSSLEQGKYTFRIIVQTEMANGEYEDLNFLNKAAEFFVDSTDPPPPDFDIEDGVYSEALAVQLAHTDLVNPLGSPVSIYYKLNETFNPDPLNDADKILFNGVSIDIAVSDITQTLSAVAIDEAGNVSSVDSKTYNFMNIDAAFEHNTPNNYVNISNNDAFIDVIGFNFDLITPLKVYLADSDGTIVPELTPPSISADKIIFTVNLQGGGIPGEQGDDIIQSNSITPGKIVVTNETTGFPSHSIDFWIFD
jgi:hypothetical protein